MAVREHCPYRLDANRDLGQRFERRGREPRAAADVEGTPDPSGDMEVLSNGLDDAVVYRGSVVGIIGCQPGTVVDAL